MITIIVDKIDENSNLYKRIVNEENSLVKIYCRKKTNVSSVKSLDEIVFNERDFILFLKDDVNILNDFFEVLNKQKGDIVFINKYHKSKTNFHYQPDTLHAKYGDVSVYNNRFLYNDLSTMAFRFKNKNELLQAIDNKENLLKKIIQLDIKKFGYISNVFLEGSDIALFDASDLKSINKHFSLIKSHITSDSVINPTNHFYLYSLWSCFRKKSNIFFSKKNYNELKLLYNDLFTFDYYLFLITTNCFNLEKEFLFFLYLRKYNLFRSITLYLLSIFRKIKRVSPNLYYLFVIPMNLFVYLIKFPIYAFNGLRDVIKVFLKFFRGWK